MQKQLSFEQLLDKQSKFILLLKQQYEQKNNNNNDEDEDEEEDDNDININKIQSIENKNISQHNLTNNEVNELNKKYRR